MVTDEMKGKLSGTYELIVGPKQPISRKDLLRSSLTMTQDGRFSQVCVFQGGVTEAIDGTWNLIEGGIQFSSFKDCAGVWPLNLKGNDTGASLIIEMSSPPTILLSPDVNVYYRRLPKGPP
jgi:hypothetical protein